MACPLRRTCAARGMEAKVEAPAPNTHAGYIGLLPIKLQGKLICPGGRFEGIFFSEELRFALANGYTLLSIKLAYQFKRGDNTFLQLITKLNSMKIEAQRNNQPTIRNLAKLLMNSMYGRFGMHPSLTKHYIWTQEQIDRIAAHWQIENQIDFGELHIITALLDRDYILKTPKSQKVKTHEIKKQNKIKNCPMTELGCSFFKKFLKGCFPELERFLRSSDFGRTGI